MLQEGLIYTTVPEAEATRGHISAHSFATGPVMAEPFISPFGLTMTPALSAGECRVSGCGSRATADARTLKVQEDTIATAPRFPLAHNHRRVD